jgi:radical SAM superfamily enzyme YgiQ (UPF0313 family)
MKPRAVLLVNPNRMKPPVAPLGLEYAAAALRRHGRPFEILDLTFAEDWSAAVDGALNETYAAICVSIRNIDDAYFASRDFILADTAAIIGRIRNRTRTPVILGGIGFAMAPCEVLAFTRADYGIAGADENILPDLLDCLESGSNPADIPCAVWRTAEGVIIENGCAHTMCGPPAAPDRGVFDTARYFLEGGQAGLETRRGCTGQCIYCPEPEAKGRAFRLRDMASLQQEITALLDAGADVLHLCDSEFNLPREQAMAFCRMMAATGFAARVRWYAYAAPAPFDLELARAMAAAGCAGINFGADHADPAMLRGLGRSYPPEAIREAATACRNAGIAVMFDMLLGGPGETRESMKTAIEFMRESGADRVGISCGIRVYPNTPLARMIRRQGPLDENPHLHGATRKNENLLKPVFYVEAEFGENIHAVIAELTGGDSRFLHANPAEADGNYNYNDNAVLTAAIGKGARGAYWDILRRIGAGEFAD